MTRYFIEIFPINIKSVPPLTGYRVDIDEIGGEINTVGGKLSYRLQREFKGNWAYSSKYIVTDSKQDHQAVQNALTAIKSEAPDIYRSIARATARYQAHGRRDGIQLIEDIGNYAHCYPQHGYRHITALMRRDGHKVNHKRIERLWRQEGLQLLRRKKTKRRSGEGGDVKQRAAYANPVWSYDFTEDHTPRSQKIWTLAVMDESTRESLMLYAATLIPSKRVWEILQWLFSIYGVPEHLHSDNGPEPASRLTSQSTATRQFSLNRVIPGKPLS